MSLVDNLNLSHVETILETGIGILIFRNISVDHNTTAITCIATFSSMNMHNSTSILLVQGSIIV
jgi:hypothetical protein